MKNILLALGGACVGGALGFFGFYLLAKQGFYALVLPGGLLGLCAGIVPTRSILVAVVCGLAATALGLFTEFHFFPFVADESLGYFLSHLGSLKPVTWLMIAVGGAIGFYVPFRRRLPRGVP
jgi:hypothetical protein